jgi:RNA polymerase sigma factor (sigma-70 family)
VVNGRHGGVWRHTQTLFNGGVIGDVADEQLLERFVTARGEAGELAFEALVERHGPMVLRVCRTILRDGHDAEDAFQATFLVLARRAGSIRSRSSVASWLHGVARRVASSARSAASRRREHERTAADRADSFLAEPRWDDLALVLHEEIDRLPERFRAPIVLCDMEGMTEGQAAQRLGRPVGTIRSHITRGRQRLRFQLIRRGLAPATVVLVAERAGCSAHAVVASRLVSSTIPSAMQFAVARATTTGMVSAAATALAEEFLGSMLMARIKNTVMAVLVAIGIATAGAFAFEPQAEKPPSMGDPKHELLELMHAWTKALVQSDAATMDRLLAYEMVGTDPGGWVWDKSKYVELVKGDAFHIESAKLEDSKVHVYGDAAVVTNLLLTNVNSKQWPSFVQRSTSTWIRRHGSWQCVAWQSNVIHEHAPDVQPPDSASAPNPRRGSVAKGGPGLIPTSPRPVPPKQ